MDKNKYIFPIIVIGVVVAIILIVVFVLDSGDQDSQTESSSESEEQTADTAESSDADSEDEQSDDSETGGESADSASQLVINTLTEGEGDVVAENGDRITVDYEGRLDDQNGSVFDSSETGPFSFVLGEGKVIAGWEQGLVGVKVGQVLTLTIPPELAYGATPPPGIPPNSTLFFEIEVLDISSS